MLQKSGSMRSKILTFFNILCRFREDGTEDLEDSISNPTNNPTVMSVADQVEILEV